MAMQGKQFLLFSIYLLCSISQLQAQEAKKTVCLNMIVKDEKDVITRCLESTKPLIDYWVIVDTGSTDGTQTIIRDYLKDIPGELHERQWRNFAHNRNEALELAKGKGDYLLFIDADEKFVVDKDFNWPALTHDYYYVKTEYGGTEYVRNQLIKGNLPWKWIGAVHEALNCDKAGPPGTLQGITNLVNTDGARSKDLNKFLKDAQILEESVRANPESTRDQFYLAQSYRDAGENKLALAHYEKRISMKGWDEEIYWSMLQVALLMERMHADTDKIVQQYQKTYEFRPHRAETLYYLANFYRRLEDYEKSYQTALKGLALSIPQDILFIENWIYNWGLHLEFSIAAYWTERYTESLLASDVIAGRPKLPENVSECVESNRKWAISKLQESHVKSAGSNKSLLSSKP